MSPLSPTFRRNVAFAAALVVAFCLGGLLSSSPVHQSLHTYIPTKYKYALRPYPTTPTSSPTSAPKTTSVEPTTTDSTSVDATSCPSECPPDPYAREGMILFPRRRLRSTVPPYSSSEEDGSAGSEGAGNEDGLRLESPVDPNPDPNPNSPPPPHQRRTQKPPSKHPSDPSYTRWAPFSTVLDREGILRVVRTGVLDSMQRVTSSYAGPSSYYPSGHSSTGQGQEQEDGPKNRTKTGPKSDPLQGSSTSTSTSDSSGAGDDLRDVFGEGWGKKGGWAGLAGYPVSPPRGFGAGRDRHEHGHGAHSDVTDPNHLNRDHSTDHTHPDPDPGPLGELAPDYTYALSQRDHRVEWARGKVGLFVGHRESGGAEWHKTMMGDSSREPIPGGENEVGSKDRELQWRRVEEENTSESEEIEGDANSENNEKDGND